jgi:glycosyltransferase involved in cell wall biosynthesis
LTQHETGWACVDAVYRDLDARVARDLQSAVGKGLKGVYCYEDGALETFKAARKLGLQTVYELPIAYWETSTRLLSEEAERWPEWEPTLVGTRDSDAKLARKTEELSLADVVVTPSQFVYDSLPESIRESKACVVSPFGSPQVPEFNGESLDDSAGPLRVLFAGSLTQRKGLADLFQAISLLKRRDVELIVLGKPVVSLEFYRRQMPTFVYESPRPHAEVLKLMRSCHLMALPSIVEGRALVQQEALANGLPILVTANAGGQDLIEEGRTGFLVPMRSPEKLAEKIDFLADNRSIIPEMRRHARKKAAEYTWERYGRNIVDAMLAHGK